MAHTIFNLRINGVYKISIKLYAYIQVSHHHTSDWQVIKKFLFLFLFLNHNHNTHHFIASDFISQINQSIRYNLQFPFSPSFFLLSISPQNSSSFFIMSSILAFRPSSSSCSCSVSLQNGECRPFATTFADSLGFKTRFEINVVHSRRFLSVYSKKLRSNFLKAIKDDSRASFSGDCDGYSGMNFNFLV